MARRRCGRRTKILSKKKGNAIIMLCYVVRFYDLLKCYREVNYALIGGSIQPIIVLFYTKLDDTSQSYTKSGQ